VLSVGVPAAALGNPLVEEKFSLKLLDVLENIEIGICFRFVSNCAGFQG